MNVGYYPRRTSPNIYSDLICSLLSDDFNVKQISPKRMSDLKFLLSRPDCVIINWVENFCVTKKGWISVWGTLFALTWFILMKLFARRVVYVRHNEAPHCAKDSSIIYCKKIIGFFEKFSDLVICHSPLGCVGKPSNKYRYIPHPIYPVSFSEDSKWSGEKYFLFFGMITRSKGLAELVKSWPTGERLIIAGGAPDPEFCAELRDLASDNILIKAGHWTGRDEGDLFSGAKAVLLPNTGGRAFVSAGFMYALSHRKCVLAVSSPYLHALSKKYPDAPINLANSISDLTGALKDFKNSSEELDILISREFFSALQKEEWLEAVGNFSCRL